MNETCTRHSSKVFCAAQRVRAPPCPRKGLSPPETVGQFVFDELFSARVSGHRASAGADARPGKELIVPTPTRTLPPHPQFDQLKRQAKELLDAFRAGDATAI